MFQFQKMAPLSTTCSKSLLFACRGQSIWLMRCNALLVKRFYTTLNNLMGKDKPYKRPRLEKGQGWTPEQLKSLKLKKQAVLVSYCGAGYYGLQISRELPTIEGEVLKAFLKAGMVLQEHIDVPQSIWFQRAARTDKGVSAVRQILSCLLPSQFNEAIPKVNEALPPGIRVVASKFTTKNFDAKNACCARTYAYMMPTYALCPPDALTAESYRVTPEIVDEYNKILSQYKGSHNFHNFTSQKAPMDPSSVRFIISIECGQPFVVDGVEFVVVRIKGQSFMMHQIRKMIGLSLGVVRGYANLETIEKSFKLKKFDIPRAPGLGLVLEEVHYDRYNARFGGDGIHEALVWSEYSDVLDTFKREKIYPVIVETEKKEHSMLTWLETLPLHTYGERTPGPPPERSANKDAVPVTDSRPLYAKALCNAQGKRSLEEEGAQSEADRVNSDEEAENTRDEDLEDECEDHRLEIRETECS